MNNKDLIEVITDLMNALSYYANPETGWELSEHADAYENAKEVIKELEIRDATVTLPPREWTPSSES